MLCEPNETAVYVVVLQLATDLAHNYEAMQLYPSLRLLFLQENDDFGCFA